MYIIVNTGIHHNDSNFNFKLPVFKIHRGIMVSVVDFEAEWPGSSPD